MQRGSVAIWLIIIVSLIALIAGVGLAMHDDRRPVAPAEPPMSEDDLRKLVNDPACLESGRKIFGDLCKTCHGPSGEGLIGPNLRDDYWLHGSSMRQIVDTIANGNPPKGMAAWKTTYTPEQICALAAFVVTLKGRHDGPDKAPEGAYEPINYR